MISVQGNSLILKTPYNPGLVAELKASIPAADRKFEPATKGWIVAPKYGRFLADLVAKHFGVIVQVPKLSTAAPVEETRVMDIRYVGQTKLKEGFDFPVAFGYCDGQWSAIFSETVLRCWFEGISTPQAQQFTTLYGTLGIGRDAGQDDIKTAFRRLARQWHPDVCKEPGSQEMFIKIKNAYDLLSDAGKRARYDAGLALEASLERAELIKRIASANFATSGYRSPLRCGYVLATGAETIGRFVVSEILGWEDIVNEYGLTLVTSWPSGAQMFLENWV